MRKTRLAIESEKELVAAIKKDPTLFGIIFDQYYPVIFGYIFRRMADYDLARDIASETFLKGFVHFSSFHWKGVPVSAWLYRIANNEMQQYLRKKKYIPSSIDLMMDRSGWDLIDPKTTDEERLQFEKEMSQQSEFIRVQQKIKQMPIIYQEVLSLRYFEQKAVKEIATILGKSEGTVKSLLSRGIEKLKKLL